jgi:hypothetical protein
MTFPSHPTRSQRGAVLPSPVVLLSIVAVALAAVAFVTTRGEAPTERDVTATKAAATPSASAGATGAPAADPTPTAPAEKPKKQQVKRGNHAVVVFNNTSTTGLAGRVAETVTQAGWKLAATDNWYGTVPATTVYYPAGKKAAGRLLALDLGVARVLPAERGSDMSSSNLTLILTGPLD